MIYEDRGLEHEKYRAVSAEWNLLTREMRLVANRLRNLGEPMQAAALEVDLAHLERRAYLHLRQVLAKLERQDLPEAEAPCDTQTSCKLTAPP